MRGGGTGRGLAAAGAAGALVAAAIAGARAAPALVPAEDGGAPVMPHPAPNAAARLALERGCESCHAAIAAEWRTSLHHTSFTDATFQRAFAEEPDPFCKGCHAPEEDAALGVGCVTCHVTDGAVLAATRGTSAQAAPHALARSAAFAGVGACARCHEFDFPDARLRQVPLAMQRTVTEHAGRADACASCHMPRQGGHVDHRFAASRDEAFVRSAVVVTARRTSLREVEVTITPAAVGHAFPTGDLFRRVRVTVGAETRYLARHFENREERPGVLVKIESADDRVLGVPRVVTLPAPEGPVRVEVVYERAEGASQRASSRARVAGSVGLFDGTL